MLGTVLGLLGGATQGTGQYLAGRKQRKVSQQENARQLQNAERAQQISNQNISAHGASAANSALAAGQQQRKQLMQELQGQQLFSPSVAPQMNVNARLRNAQQLNSRAALGSYNDWALRQTIQSILAQNELNKLYDQAVGDMALYDTRMDEAGSSYGALQGMGSGLSLAGGLGNALKG